MDTLDSGRRWTGGLVCDQQKEVSLLDGLISFICLFFTPLSLHSNLLITLVPYIYSKDPV